MTFTDREDAGRRLAVLVADHDIAARHPVVLGLARGGIPVAAEVARALGAPLDVLLVRKIGAPGQPELGLGAIGEGDVEVLDPDLVGQLHVDAATIGQIVARERTELARQADVYRRGQLPYEVAGRAVLLVDDGVATGGSVRAALATLRARGAGEVVLAVPVIATSTAAALGDEVADVIAVVVTERLGAVGQHYARFAPTADAEVLAALAPAR